MGKQWETYNLNCQYMLILLHFFNDILMVPETTALSTELQVHIN